MTDGGTPPDDSGTGSRAERDGPGGRTEAGPRFPATEADAAGERSAARPPAADDETFYCDLCGNVMLNLHCKLICEQCGYKRDCSDP